MSHNSPLSEYISRFDNLSLIVNETTSRLLSDNSDKLISDNINFFTKSFLVLMCTYLESYLKDVLMLIINETNSKLRKSKIPHNLIKWSVDSNRTFKEKDYKFENYKLELNRDNLDKFISGNPYRTKDLFQKFGIEIHKNDKFNFQIEFIQSIVTKRNKVIHYNDDASDVSNSDLINYIENIKEYIRNIDEIIQQNTQ